MNNEQKEYDLLFNAIPPPQFQPNAATTLLLNSSTGQRNVYVFSPRLFFAAKDFQC